MLVLIEGAEQVTVEWLTQVLGTAGMLRTGKVVQFTQVANTAYHSQTTKLQLTFANFEAEQPPAQLFLKILSRHKGQREAEMYQQLMRQSCYPSMLVPCYGAGYDCDTGTSNLVLADVSSTHQEVSSRAEVRTFSASPPIWQVEQMVQVLAHWHALRWSLTECDRSFERIPDAFTNEASYLAEVSKIRDAWFRFSKTEIIIASEFEALYLPLIEGIGHLWKTYIAERFSSSLNLTVVHGDCYFSQFLCPKYDRSSQTFLIDFDSVRADLATDDLVTLLATFWHCEQRRENELAILKRYHKTLCEAGIHSYSWAAFLQDYRFSILWHMIYPIFGNLAGDTTDFWRLRLSAMSQAYNDWRCDRLFKMAEMKEIT